MAGLLVLVLTFCLYGWRGTLPLLVIAVVGIRLGANVFFSTYKGLTGEHVILPRDVAAPHFHRWLRESLPYMRTYMTGSLASALRTVANWERGREKSEDRKRRADGAMKEFLAACCSDPTTGPLIEAAGWQMGDLERFMRVFEGQGSCISGAITLCTPHLLQPFLDELRSSNSVKDAVLGAIVRTGFTDTFVLPSR
jgi:hypothetical protein